MPSAYTAFVSSTIRKAPTGLSQPEKMKWCGQQWRSRKESKGGQVGKGDKEDEEWLEKKRAEIKKKMPPKPPKDLKPTDNRVLTKGKGKGLKAGGRGLVAPGAKAAKSGRGAKTPKVSGGKPVIKPDVFKETAKIARVAGKTGALDDFVSRAAMGGVTTVRGRKGANLISIKNHK